jgi:hypothetical protein
MFLNCGQLTPFEDGVRLEIWDGERRSSSGSRCGMSRRSCRSGETDPDIANVRDLRDERVRACQVVEP